MEESSISPPEPRPRHPLVVRHPIAVRQPVSCEPCRRRKIKCSRTRAPCDTCRRRGCVNQCFYKGSRDDGLASAANGVNKELLDRLANLEMLLKKQTSGQKSAVTPEADEGGHDNMAMLSPPLESSNHSIEASPGSFASEAARSPNTYQSAPVNSHGVQVGVLTSIPGGNVRYDPRTSQWTSVLANTGLATESFEDYEDLSTTSLGFPFIPGPVPSMNELLAILPPVQHCEHLKNTYFTVFSPLFHILHDPSFHAQYAIFLEQPTSVPISWLAILFILLSLAVTSVDENDLVIRDLARGPNACSNIRMLSRRYRDAAMCCLAKQGVFWGKHNVQSLQALIMLVYAMGHDQVPTWILLGMTNNVAIALACHIDPERFDLNPIQSEERRRCWAGLMMLYTIQNTVLGNPDSSWRMNYTVQLPADVDDTSITLSGILPNPPGPTQMTYLLFKFRLYDLAARISQEITCSNEPDRFLIQDLDHEICLAQETWDKRYLADSTFEALPTHHAVHLHILHAYSHQLFLLLHRPFFAQSIIGLDVHNESQIRCIASAEALLDIHRTLSETPRFRPYVWYINGLGSFFAFHGAAVLSVTLLMPVYRPHHQKFRSVLEEALGRFEAARERSHISAKAAKILRALLALPSPKNASSLPVANPAGNIVSHDEAWPMTEELRGFAERLQPQQWLGPGTLAWNEWDTFMARMDEGGMEEAGTIV